MTTTVFYEPIEEEEILFQPQDMTVEYVSKTKVEINNEEISRLRNEISRLQILSDAEKSEQEFQRLNTREAWQQAFYAEGMRSFKIKKCITFRHGGKNRRFKILTHDNMNFIRFQSMGEFHYMRPIYYKGKIVLNHYTEIKEGRYQEKLTDIDYRVNIGFFCNNPEDERYGNFIDMERHDK